MFNEETEQIIDWFHSNLVQRMEWNLEHPDTAPSDASHDFNSYKHKFTELGYKVWDMQNKQHANSYIKLTSRENSRWTLLAGRADFLITTNDVTAADYLNKILCVIEIQSNDNEERCEMQMLVYLLILMNTRHLRELLGFLVYRNGLCRAFKASRNEDGNCVYEMNKTFHVVHIADVFHSLFVRYLAEHGNCLPLF
jgi:hypothetical protein